uniref:Tetraspanin n=1 Tax=Saccoglossus kowalevskii TaxID=10224 RepID=A0ABM0MV80_SACKO|nr:PREDICTED: CD151 antigen-like [Saccoglossus kowalevskii]
MSADKTKVTIKKKLGCGAKCLKFLIFFFNFIFLIAGCAVLGVGVWIYIESTSIKAIMGSSLLLNSAYTLMVAGAIAILMAALGCCGAWKENKCLLMTYFIALMIIFFAELVGGIMAYAYRNDAKFTVKKSMQSTLKEAYGLEGNKGVTDTWDDTQRKFECCGVEGNTTDAYQLWLVSDWYVEQVGDPKEKVPSSCCKRNDDGDVINLQECQQLEPDFDNPDQVNTEGCFDSVYEFILDNSLVIGGVGVGIAFIQIFGMVFALCLFRQL